VIRKLFHGKSSTITSAAIIVAGFSILSRVVGFVRDRILAGQFGAGEDLDVYFAAFRIPDFLFQMIVVGALSASFIPLFSKYYRLKGHDRAWAMTNNVLNVVLVLFVAIAGIGIALADYYAPLIAYGLSPELQSQVADLSRIMLGAQVLLAISMVYGSVLQSVRRFFLYSFAPIFYNFGIIFGALFLAPKFGVIGLAYGVFIGAAMHMLIQTYGVLSLGYRYWPRIKLKAPEIKYIVKHMPPRVLGLAVNQLNFVLMTVLASTVTTGAITILQFAYNLNFFPIGVIGVSFAIASFPALCEYASGESSAQFKEAFSGTVRQILFFIVPATILFVLMRAQIVRAVVGAGEFGWTETIITADLLGFFAISFFSQAIVYVLIRAFFAYEDTMTPFWIALLSLATNIGLAFLFVQEFGIAGFGMAFSISSVLQMIALWTILRARIGSLGEWRIIKSTSILVVAGALAGITIQIMENMVVVFFSIDTFLGIVGQVLIAGGMGMLMYALATYLMRSEEMISLLAGMKKRFFKRAKPAEPIATAQQ